jgi:O-antigen/teichoic acid export membrane protein
MTRQAAKSGEIGVAAVARGISWVGAGHVIGQMAWFGSLLLVSALVPPGSFGSVSIAMVVVQVAWLLVGCGTRAGLVVSPGVSRAQLRRSVSINVATGLAIGLAAALLAGPLVRTLAPGADPLVLAVLALSIGLYGFSIVPLALLQREMQFKRHASVNAGAALLASALAVAGALAGLGVWALVLRQVLFQALLAAFAWVAARTLVPAARAEDAPARRDPVAWWFFALGVIVFVAYNVDYVLVGRFADVTQVGLYSLAFAIAFAPVTQLAWQIGKVLFTSTAREGDRTAAGARAARAARLTALLVWPLVAPMVVLAPHVLPWLLGDEWRPMVVPFQLLLVAGAVHGVLAVIREFLLGAGNVRVCLAVDAAWLVATVLALLALVPALGIAGAALAHVALLAPLGVAYTTLAARRLGLAPGALWRAMRLIVVAVGVQAFMTALESTLMSWAGASTAVAAAAGAAVGVIGLLLLLMGGETPPQRELAGLLRAVRAPRSAAPPAATPAIAAAAPAHPPAGGGLARRLAVAGLLGAAALAGLAAAYEPRWAAGLVALSLALVVAFRAPVAHLLTLVALTTIVPLVVQARFGSGGTVDSAGILPSDVVLLTGLVRALLVLPHQPLRRLTSVAVGLTALFLVLDALQLLHAVALGRPLSGVGGEFRALLGFGALLVALPLLADPVRRRRLLAGLAGLGLALGVWGLVQFALHLRFYEPDAPFDPGSFTTGGLVIGMFAFPIAAIVALAVLTGLPRRRPAARALLYGVLLTNCAAVVLTFERTFIVTTLAGFALVFLRGNAPQRARVMFTALTALGCCVLALAVASPAALSAYRTRVASLASARSDPSVTYRLEESRMITGQIRGQPLTGSALGATILIGRPGTSKPLAPRRYAENGYLWLAWKVGVPAALVLLVVLALAAMMPGPRGEDLASAMLRRGCQAGVAAALMATLSFGSFTQIGMTAGTGVLVALCVAAPPLPRVKAAA